MNTMHGKTRAELQFIIRDAREAIAANPENPKCAIYEDEIKQATRALRRQKAGQESQTDQLPR